VDTEACLYCNLAAFMGPVCFELQDNMICLHTSVYASLIQFMLAKNAYKSLYIDS
jgi:hypothetical protein